MVTRTKLQEIVYNEILAATSGLVDPDNVGQRFPPVEEQTAPAVKYQDNYRTLPINRASASPDKVVRDVNGDVVAEEHHEHEEGVFSIDVRAGFEDVEKEIYEAIHQHFGRFHNRYVADVKDLHSDINKISVSDVSDNPDQNALNPFSGSTVEVAVRFHRVYLIEGDNIVEINHSVEEQGYTTTGEN